MSDCPHLNFVAIVNVARLFEDPALDEAATNEMEPDTLSLDISGHCEKCGKQIRFEGPIGIGVGPGAVPMVSLDGTELHAPAHMGRRDGRTIIARMRLR